MSETKLCYGEHAHMHSFPPSQGYHLKKWKAKQAMYYPSNGNTPCRGNNGKYLWSQDDAKSQLTKTLIHIGIFPFDGRATTYGYLVY